MSTNDFVSGLMVFGAFAAGWCVAKAIPAVPPGIDPEFWRDRWRAYKRGRGYRG